MPKIYWKFTIRYCPRNSLGTRSNGIFAGSSEDVKLFAEILNKEPTIVGESSFVDVYEQESSSCLKKLTNALESKYSFFPSSNFIVPSKLRCKYFGLQKLRKYTADELGNADFLYLNYSKKGIANHRRGTESEVECERYVVARHKKKKTVPFGILMPFHALAVTGELKSQMEDAGLVGLDVSEPVINGDDIWKLSSSIRLPRCGLPLVDNTGAEVDCDNWSGKFCQKYFDDRGYRPPELTYSRSEIGKLGEFDIAVTAERTGNHIATSARWCVVSQRFRRTMEALKVPGVVYVPVRLT